MLFHFSKFSKSVVVAGMLLAVSAFAEGVGPSTQTTMEKRTLTRTAQDQSTSPRDVELTRKIREQIVADKSLSMRAKNVTIISQNGQVTLKGPVATNQEQAKVEEIAKKAAGTTSVVNQTEVSTTY